MRLWKGCVMWVKELADVSRTVLVTHGNLMALLLKYFDDRFGFEE